MRHTPPLRRSLALATAGVLAAGLAWLPAGPASAITVPSQFGAQAQSNTNATCPLTSAPGSDSVNTGPINVVNGHAQGGVTLNSAYTNTGNSSDTVTVSGAYNGSMTLATSHGVVTSMKLTGSGQLDVAPALGAASACKVTAQLTDVAAAESNVAKPGWYFLKRSTSKSSLSEAVLENATTSEFVTFDIYQGGANTTTLRAFAAPGTYVAELVGGIVSKGTLILRNGVSRSALTNTATLTFVKAGAALGPTKGSATQHVAFPAAVSCTHHTATLRWKSGAGAVKSGTFWVNGRQVKSVSSPSSGTSVVLRHLSASQDAKVTAKLLLGNGSRQSASRSYVACRE